MEYDVRVRVQGAPGETGQVPPLIVDTEGHLAVERGHCALSYYQYEGEEAVPVKTSIRLERSTVAMERSDHTTMVFDRKRPVSSGADSIGAAGIDDGDPSPGRVESKKGTGIAALGLRSCL